MANETLVSDIYQVVQDGVEVEASVCAEFGATLAQLISDRLNPKDRIRPFSLRMSNLGKGDRQLYYDKKFGRQEKLAGHTHIKFMYGELVEQLILFLAKVSGNVVSAEQQEVEIGGIKGHIDSDINGVTVDVKSTSQHGFRKFSQGTLLEDDPFGYIEQIAGYSKARDTDGAFLAVDKVTGHLAYLEFPKEELARVVNIEERIEHLKTVVAADIEPPRCYEDQPEGESGNKVLALNCSYCDHKFHCWRDANGGLGLRTFLYSTGPKHFTSVRREPKVKEVTF